jgi:hypothetical protein
VEGALTAAKVDLALQKAVGWAEGAWDSLEKQWDKLVGS